MSNIAAWQPETIALCLDEPTTNTETWKFDFNDTANVDQSKLISNMYHKDNPSTQTELLSTQDDQVQEIIYQIRTSKYISNNANIANQLLVLFDMAKEENPKSMGIAVDSLVNFYDFMLLHTNIITPTLSLSPNYNIYAAWRTKEQLFSAHFLQNGEVRFVLFKPNKRHPKHKIRITGTATNDTLLEITRPENLKHWVFDERR